MNNVVLYCKCTLLLFSEPNHPMQSVAMASPYHTVHYHMAWPKLGTAFHGSTEKSDCVLCQNYESYAWKNTLT